MNERVLITLKDARGRLGISKTTMSKHVREGRFTVYSNPRDSREKLVDWTEVQAAFEPQPVRQPQDDESGRPT